MRLFIAIELPEYLKTSLGRMRSDIPGARWVPAEQIHLTLAFLGEVDDKTAELLARELEQIEASTFKLSFSGTGCFPNRHHPHVVWVGVKPDPALTRLAAKVHTAVLACGIPQEERPFSPHITLARLKLPCAIELGTFLDQHREVKLKKFSVTNFTLFQSRLTQQGALHVPIRNFPLAAPAVNG